MKKTKMTVMIIGICMLFVLCGCTKAVSDYEMTIQVNGVEYTGRYTGSVKKGMPVDSENGTFISGEEGSGEFFKYDGQWLDGHIAMSGTMTQEQYQLEFAEKTLSGTYQGAVKDGLPDGEGEFTASLDQDISFKYTGKWSEGKLADKGYLEYDELVVTLSNDRIRTGIFKGEVFNGIPEGTGTYSSVNDYGESYTYTGEFSKGSINGKGKIVFEDSINEGTFVDGDFRPTVLEYIQSYGYRKKDCEYTLSKETRDFITKNEKLFTDNTSEGIEDLMIPDFDVKVFQKNTQSYKPGFVQIKGLKVIQIFEVKDVGGVTTHMLAVDSDYKNYFRIHKFNSAPGVVEDSIVNVWFMPLDYSTYETIGGSENYAVVGFALDISK